MAKVEDGLIICPRHSSRFSIRKARGRAGPAQSAPASKDIALDGDQISVS